MDDWMFSKWMDAYMHAWVDRWMGGYMNTHLLELEFVEV